MTTQTEPTIQELSSIEDLGALVLGDIVRVNADFKGKPVRKLMAVVENVNSCIVERGKVSLAYRVSGEGIYHRSLPFSEGRVVDGELHFDYSKGECIRIWGSDWVNYEMLRVALENAGID